MGSWNEMAKDYISTGFSSILAIKVPIPSQNVKFYSLDGAPGFITLDVLWLYFVEAYVATRAEILMFCVCQLLVSEAVSWVYSGKVSCGSLCLEEVKNRLNVELLGVFLIFENKIILLTLNSYKVPKWLFHYSLHYCPLLTCGLYSDVRFLLKKWICWCGHGNFILLFCSFQTIPFGWKVLISQMRKHCHCHHTHTEHKMVCTILYVWIISKTDNIYMKWFFLQMQL